MAAAAAAARLSPGNQRRAPTAAVRLYLARTQLLLPADRPSPPATLVATWDAMPLPRLGTHYPCNPTPQCCQPAVQPASQEEGSGDHLRRPRHLLLCHPGPRAGNPSPIRSWCSQRSLGSYSMGERWAQNSYISSSSSHIEIKVRTAENM